jgi:hypothetical protein
VRQRQPFAYAHAPVWKVFRDQESLVLHTSTRGTTVIWRYAPKKPVAIVTSTNAKNRNDCTEVTVARHGMQLMQFEMNINCKASNSIKQ